MSILYVNDNKAKISIRENQVIVDYADGMQRRIPVETLDALTILGKPQMTTQFIETCLQKGMNVNFFSKGGKYFGRLMSTGHVKAPLQRRQAALYDTEFALQLSRNIIGAKIRNQRVVLRRYMSSTGQDLSEEMKMMRICEGKAQQAESISALMGFEGQAAKMYFRGLSACIDSDFAFTGRNRRPPRDPFNSMISLGYSILMNELYGEIESRGLNPYFGFLHRDAEHHPTLASDMMEEWRAVIIDTMVMALINGHEVGKDQFEISEEGCFLNRDALNTFLKKLENKLQTKAAYLDYVPYRTSFRRSIALQIQKLEEAILEEDAAVYQPVKIR